MIGTGSVWVTSAIRAPIVTTISIPRVSAAEATPSEKVRQRRFGSVPAISTRSRSARGARAAISTLPGHSIWRAWPSARLIVGRFAWKSKNSSGSICAITSASRDSAAAVSAVVAAPAASFQPAKAQTITGDRNSGGSPSHTRASMNRAYRLTPPGGAARPTGRRNVRP